MQPLLQLSAWIDGLNTWIVKIGRWLVLLMVLIGVWNVIGRYLGRGLGINLSSNAFLEAQWYLFDLVFLLGAAYTLLRNEHVRVDLFYGSWGPKRQALADLIGTVLYLIPFSVMVIWCSRGAVIKSWQIWEQSPDPGGLPRYPIKTVIVIGFALLILQGISEAIKRVAYLGDIPVSPRRAQGSQPQINTESLDPEALPPEDVSGSESPDPMEQAPSDGNENLDEEADLD